MTHLTRVSTHFHIDKRAAEIAASPGSDDDLLTTRQLAEWFGVSRHGRQCDRPQNRKNGTLILP
jgi:hypothetical protein